VQLTFRRLLIWLGYLALGAYVLLGVAFLGMRYWVLPQIDQWREPLQRELSDMLPVQVELGAIVARWHGRNPQISLRDTVLRDDEGRELLSIPSLQAVVAWSSLLSGRPRFLELRAEGVDLTLRRDAGDRISLVGYEMNPGGTSSSRGRGSAGLMHWLSGQDRVRFTHSRIVWHDEYRAAPPLELRDVSLELARKGDGHVFAVQATPPATLGEGFRLQAEMQLALAPDQSISLNELSGLFHVHVEAMRPLGWQPWLDVHSALGSGRVSWLGWQQVDRGALGRHVSQVVVKEGSWHPGEGMHVRADRATLHLAGDWASLHALFAGEDTAQAATGRRRPTSRSPCRWKVWMSRWQNSSKPLFVSSRSGCPAGYGGAGRPAYSCTCRQRSCATLTWTSPSRAPGRNGVAGEPVWPTFRGCSSGPNWPPSFITCLPS
jgi:uncharacterized protein YhdP